jgi:hypothetical protein
MPETPTAESLYISPQAMAALAQDERTVVVIACKSETAPQPIWYQFPGRNKKDPFTHLPASTLRDIIKRSQTLPREQRIRTKKLQNKKHAIRMIHLPSLLEYIESLPDGEETPAIPTTAP